MSMENNSFLEQMPPVTRNIIAINAIVGLTDFVLGKWGIDLVNWLGLFNFGYSAFHGAYSFHIWQPFTYMFMHSGFWHFFCNMFAVWMFGPIIEREWGAKRFIIYYMVCGIGASVVQEFTWALATGDYPAVTIGASGAVFGILLAFAWLFPEQKMFLLFIPIPISSRIFVGLYALLELAAGFSGLPGDNVAHFAHLGGMVFGFVLIKIWQYKDNNKGRKGRFQVYEGRDFSEYHYKDPIK